ncbi:pyridoxal phosphate-dependent aminotransferase family protein [Myroides odoratimimus]|uniref:Aminotransferase class I/classII large domain-containing protein n=1 Tax=Myroides odoratimimus CIP 101113 TaxID=883154 RepID=A0AAV3F1D9_9FLAO|nr:pyridoxal phosphate-dependent aminotransferase family protein [Myroides odoratimimus]EHO09521.1 hypothetical protein HMPREF9715_02365 [Myroides odoratimimus CIP 101113]MCA4807568.1 pyridoxal phosphate-dependent aminotransferase family protein [Myroides odoratimimus]MDM1093467.1 pyridoxal phosphate-dependent aminotransferase family protein [Myroides odoratimimus]MDM1401959.1 pyridoxal phosphate-dependent aminotransferase family protein [Myroides odoratimimus]MDM1412032.1 pyridoxal phosphate-
MNTLPYNLQRRLSERLYDQNYRSLQLRDIEAIDFLSNDYLGLSRNSVFQQGLLDMVVDNPALLSGSTGSRLISGNIKEVEEVEEYIATRHSVERALLFNSGYQANLALLGNLPTSRDTVIVDELIHRSVHDGCLLSRVRKWKFRHNDLDDLERLLNKATGDIYIAIESLYSMDGDLAPLEELIELSQRYGAYLIVDEAHAIGVYGLGRIHSLGLQTGVWATLVTYGKAMGVHGAAVLGSKMLIDSLINFASSFIYSTAPNALMAVSIKLAYLFIEKYPMLSLQLESVIKTYAEVAPKGIVLTPSPIQVISLKGIRDIPSFQSDLVQHNLNTYIVKAPTVAKGTERIRICLHVFNTREEMNLLFEIIKRNDTTP